MDIINNVTSLIISKALDVAQLQHGLIANNIANSETKNFKPSHVNFKDLFDDMSAASKGRSNIASEFERVDALNIKQYVKVDEVATRVMLDKEMVALTENTIHYQALLTAKSKLGNLMKTAINGGR